MQGVELGLKLWISVLLLFELEAGLTNRHDRCKYGTCLTNSTELQCRNDCISQLQIYFRHAGMNCDKMCTILREHNQVVDEESYQGLSRNAVGFLVLGSVFFFLPVVYLTLVLLKVHGCPIRFNQILPEDSVTDLIISIETENNFKKSVSSLGKISGLRNCRNTQIQSRNVLTHAITPTHRLFSQKH